MSALAPPPDVIAALRAPLVDFLQRIIRAIGDQPVIVTSWWRSVAHNAAVGGANGPTKWSQHLVALGMDFDGDPARFDAWVARLNAQGLHALNEGSHVHVQYLPAGILQRGHLVALGVLAA